MLGVPKYQETLEAIESLTFKESMSIIDIHAMIGLKHKDFNVREALKNLTQEGLIVESQRGSGGRLYYIRA